MKTQSTDTTVEAEKFLVSLIKKATSAEKFAQISSLSATTAKLSKRAIRRANQTLTEQEIDILFVSYHYGESLAKRLKEYLENHRNV